jgi:hypothetical protein
VRQSAGDRHEGHLLLFFKRKSRLKKGRKKESNARKTACHLGRSTTGVGRKAGANARSLYRVPQLLLRERFACAGTVDAAQLQPGPLNTYNGWLERKRQVRKGEKGITLCMPMPFKKAAETDGVQEECDVKDKIAERQFYPLSSSDY